MLYQMLWIIVYGIWLYGFYHLCRNTYRFFRNRQLTLTYVQRVMAEYRRITHHAFEVGIEVKSLQLILRDEYEKHKALTQKVQEDSDNA